MSFLRHKMPVIFELSIRFNRMAMQKILLSAAFPVILFLHLGLKVIFQESMTYEAHNVGSYSETAPVAAAVAIDRFEQQLKTTATASQMLQLAEQNAEQLPEWEFIAQANP
jgi:hypothetical protein